MTIVFQVGIQESNDGYDVHSLYGCDTEREDLGMSEVAPFSTFEGAVEYLLILVEQFKEEQV